MKPVFKHPAHSNDEPTSIVYDYETVGLVRAVFYGEDRRKDAEEFCAKYRGFDKDE